MGILMIKKFILRGYSKYKLLKYNNVIPSTKNSSDVYIVEFPKSGITWLSTIIANLNLLNSNSPMRATFFNIQQLVPDIHIDTDIPCQTLWDIPKYRFIKSHSSYCPLYKNVIYLVRNPISVMDSYYRFNVDRGSFNGSFESFVKDSPFGIKRWVSHVNSWLDKPRSQRMHLIKYESLIKKPCDTISELFTNLGLPCDAKFVSRAIDLSSLASMKDSESLYKSYDPARDVEFVGKGKSKSEGINLELKKYIIEESRSVLKKLNYDIEDL